MLEHHHIAVAALRPRKIHHAIASGADGGTGRRRKIDTLVLLPKPRDWMQSHRKARGHARKLKR